MTAKSHSHLFTADSANRTLPLLKLIVGDIVHLMAERAERIQEQASREADRDLTEPLEAEYRQRLEKLEAEMEPVGCRLEDASLGLVDFPAEIEGQRVFLCWKLGEDEVRYYHELDLGFLERKPIPVSEEVG